MKTISKLKKELDKWFSLFIRLRDATDEGLVQCFTCGKVSHYKTLSKQETLNNALGFKKLPSTMCWL